MNENAPALRNDLEFFPVTHEGQQYVLIRDHLGLTEEGKAVGLPLYRIMTLLDGTRTVRDLQMALMTLNRGLLVGTDEVQGLLSSLDASFLLDSERYKKARDKIVANFGSKRVRPCSHAGAAYPADPGGLRTRLENILGGQPASPGPGGRIRALIAPHIDISVGYRVYGRAYGLLRNEAPTRVVVLGVGHRMACDLFCLTDKDFETPLGVVKNDPSAVRALRDAGGDIVAPDDFVHRNEHSIEFQAIFLQHLLKEGTFSILPILCGSVPASVPEYTREAYLEKAGPFLKKLREILTASNEDTLLLAGIDFSHIGPKFGHELPARNLQSRAEAHDKRLLEHVSRFDSEHFWEESRSIQDQYNVCGFSALACMLEILSPCQGEVLDYQTWHEDATKSAVSYAAAVFR